MQRFLVGIVGFAALIVSPQAACRSASHPVSAREPSDAERATLMRDVIEGTWELRAGMKVVTFRVTQSSTRNDLMPVEAAWTFSLIDEAHACTQRALIREAGACIDTFYLPLDVEILSGADQVIEAHEKPIALFSMWGGWYGSFRISLGQTQIHAKVTLDGRSRGDYNGDRVAWTLTHIDQPK